MKNIITNFLILSMIIGNIFFLNSQTQRQVTGRVMDVTGELLIGVNVIEVGTTNGAVTDINGTYSLVVTTNDPVLKFTYVGFEERDVRVGNRGIIDVTMEEDLEALGEASR